MTLGRDVAGTVETIGQGVTNIAVGDRVSREIRFVPPVSNGTWAKFVVLDADNVAPTLDNVDDATAGAATLAAITAVQVVDALELGGGETRPSLSSARPVVSAASWCSCSTTTETT